MLRWVSQGFTFILFCRFNELINGTKNIKTPKIFVHPKDESEDTLFKLCSRLKYIILKNVVTKVEIIYDPDPRSSRIIEDSEWLSETIWLEDKLKKIRVWSIRYTLNPKFMKDHSLLLPEIGEKINGYSKEIICSYSDPDINPPILRIYITLEEKKSQEEFNIISNLSNDLLKIELNGLKEIDDPYIIESFPSKKKIIFVSGNNLFDVFTLPDVNPIYTISNNIHVIADTLGIEAAKKALFVEIRKVYNQYGLNVNYRHILLLCDTLCRNGTYGSVTRFNMRKNNSGVLLKCSFEESNKVSFILLILGFSKCSFIFPNRSS